MNTGERLALLSGLSPRSAFDHFMAIVTGGVNKTVFASQMTVCVEETNIVVNNSDNEKVVSAHGTPDASVMIKGRRVDVVDPEESRITVFIPTDSTWINMTTRREVKNYVA